MKRKGRRPKFNEPRKPITVTLPERTLAQLGAIDADRARAIVKLADYRSAVPTATPTVDVVKAAPGLGIIVVGPLRSLQRIDTLRMAEVLPGHFLLTMPSGTPSELIEMEIVDLLDDLPPAEEAERPLLQKLRGILNAQRKRKSVSKREILLISV
mgnify:FL=1